MERLIQEEEHIFEIASALHSSKECNYVRRMIHLGLQGQAVRGACATAGCDGGAAGDSVLQEDAEVLEECSEENSVRRISELFKLKKEEGLRLNNGNSALKMVDQKEAGVLQERRVEEKRMASAKKTHFSLRKARSLATCLR